VVKFFHILEGFVEVLHICHTYVCSSVGRVCNFFDNSWVQVSDLKKTNPQRVWVYGNYKFQITSWVQVFKNVSEQ